LQIGRGATHVRAFAWRAWLTSHFKEVPNANLLSASGLLSSIASGLRILP